MSLHRRASAQVKRHAELVDQHATRVGAGQRCSRKVARVRDAFSCVQRATRFGRALRVETLEIATFRGRRSCIAAAIARCPARSAISRCIDCAMRR